MRRLEPPEDLQGLPAGGTVLSVEVIGHVRFGGNGRNGVLRGHHEALFLTGGNRLTLGRSTRMAESLQKQPTAPYRAALASGRAISLKASAIPHI